MSKQTGSTAYRGYLLKHTNYMRGYQQRYFILKNCTLSYYKSSSEIAQGSRGAIHLLDASIKVNGNIIHVRKGTQEFYLKTASDQDRAQWVNALQLAKQEAGNNRNSVSTGVAMRQSQGRRRSSFRSWRKSGSHQQQQQQQQQGNGLPIDHTASARTAYHERDYASLNDNTDARGPHHKRQESADSSVSSNAFGGRLPITTTHHSVSDNDFSPNEEEEDDEEITPSEYARLTRDSRGRGDQAEPSDDSTFFQGSNQEDDYDVDDDDVNASKNVHDEQDEQSQYTSHYSAADSVDSTTNFSQATHKQYDGDEEQQQQEQEDDDEFYSSSSDEEGEESLIPDIHALNTYMSEFNTAFKALSEGTGDRQALATLRAAFDGLYDTAHAHHKEWAHKVHILEQKKDVLQATVESMAVDEAMLVRRIESDDDNDEFFDANSDVGDSTQSTPTPTPTLSEDRLHQPASRTARTAATASDGALVSASSPSKKKSGKKARRSSRSSARTATQAKEEGLGNVHPQQQAPNPDGGEVAVSDGDDGGKEVVPVNVSGRGHGFEFRTTVPPKPNKKVNLWGIMKNCIGKDLSKIPMPVNFNEPVSFLQRLAEDLGYSELLFKAARTDDWRERMGLVAAFTMSSYASGAARLGKPFNPLLGETFELDRMETHGFRCLLEQVSHHPPVCALHSESDEWVFWQEFRIDSKFRGKYLELVPKGISHLIFKRTNDHFTWVKVNTIVHNIILGKLWMENCGKMIITNHTTNQVCNLNYVKYSFFSSTESNTVKGEILNAQGDVECSLLGKWSSHLDMITLDDPYEKKTLWTARPPVPGADKMYYLTQFAIESNEISPYEHNCAITDSRFRPDKNLMESGDWDMANRVKHLLEEAQRFRRRERERTKTKFTPAWFAMKPDPLNPQRHLHQYKGGYWEAKARGNYSGHAIVDVYDIRPVEKKDARAAEAALGAMLMNDHSVVEGSKDSNYDPLNMSTI